MNYTKIVHILFYTTQILHKCINKHEMTKNNPLGLFRIYEFI